jgi:hypothetical protein
VGFDISETIPPTVDTMSSKCWATYVWDAILGEAQKRVVLVAEMWYH